MKIHDPIKMAEREKLLKACDIVASTLSKLAQVSWVSFSGTFGRREDQKHTFQVITTAQGVLVGGKYEDLPAVKARKAAGWVPTRGSSFEHPDPKHPYLVKGKTSGAICLQVLVPETGVKWKKDYFLDGMILDSFHPIVSAIETLTPKPTGKIENCFSIALSRIFKVTPWVAADEKGGK